MVNRGQHSFERWLLIQADIFYDQKQQGCREHSENVAKQGKAAPAANKRAARNKILMHAIDEFFLINQSIKEIFQFLIRRVMVKCFRDGNIG